MKIGEKMKRRNIFVILVLLISILSISSIFLIDGNRGLNPKELIDKNRDLHANENNTIEEDIEEVKISRAKILLTGDIMFHMPQIEAAYDRNTGNYDFSDNFKYVNKYIDGADLAIANFETVTAGDELGFFGFPQFNSPKETLNHIKDAGFDVLTTVNNHSLDRGKTGIINTIDAIEEVGMKNIGTYKEPNNDIYIEKVNDMDLALLAYSYGYNGLEYSLSPEELSYMVNTIDEDKIKSDIEAAKNANADMILIFLHWGEEYQREPSTYQVELGDKMIEWGANMVLGSHPHVIQKAKMINHNNKDNYIIYSMGNFLSNQGEATMGNRFTEDGIMVEIEIEKDLETEETYINNINYIPTWVRRYNNINKANYEIIPVKEFIDNEDLLLKLNENERLRIKESYENTMNKINEE